MKSLRKLALTLGLLALCACASRNPGDTSGSGGGAKAVDCSTVRCRACPTGQHPILKPPDCCRCVPD